jgi:hypothetical protein
MDGRADADLSTTRVALRSRCFWIEWVSQKHDAHRSDHRAVAKMGHRSPAIYCDFSILSLPEHGSNIRLLPERVLPVSASLGVG